MSKIKKSIKISLIAAALGSVLGLASANAGTVVIRTNTPPPPPPPPAKHVTVVHTGGYYLHGVYYYNGHPVHKQPPPPKPQPQPQPKPPAPPPPPH